MRALTVIPGRPESASLAHIDEPAGGEGTLLIESWLVGICGTDLEIVEGGHGSAPRGHTRLVLGHESLGRVLEAPAGCGLARGDLVVPMVRHPDPLPCPSCAVGEWDMCRNGEYTEHGIKELDGFCAERFRVAPDRVVRVDPELEHTGVLLEPTSVVAKAWEHIERIGARAVFRPERVLVTGAGPIGLLAAMLGAQRGLEVHVLDRVATGAKPALVRSLGATYHHGAFAEAADIARPDIILECTGAPEIALDVMRGTPPAGIVCLTGVSHRSRKLQVDMGELNRSLVLENDVVFGSVNANRRHYELAAAALARADHAWLGALITRRVPLERWKEALEEHDDDVKVALDFFPGEGRRDRRDRSEGGAS